MPKLLRLGVVRCVVLCVVSCIPAAFADNYPRQPAIHAQHYTFRIALSDADDKVAGQSPPDRCFLQTGVTRDAGGTTRLQERQRKNAAPPPFRSAGRPLLARTRHPRT